MTIDPTYVVLARKLRPQTFGDVIGQEHVTRTLANALTSGRIHHAFLFCGPRGVGKTTAARILARALCCEGDGRTTPTATPCGTCETCVEITAGRAIDVIEIDGASNRGIDNIRELRDSVRYQPARLRKKVFIIDEVHMLTTEAFNALLKTLEEPPPHVTFILATTEAHKLPITILSRCQRYDFKLVATQTVIAWLGQVLKTEGIEAENDALSLLARESGGSMRDALSLTDQLIAFGGGATLTAAAVAEALGVADRALLTQIARGISERDAGSILSAIDAAEMRGVSIPQLGRALLAYARDISLAAEIRDDELFAKLVDGLPTDRALLREIAAKTGSNLWPQIFERIARACLELADSPLPRAVLELALIDCIHAEPLESIANLVARLDAALSSGGVQTAVQPASRSAPSVATAQIGRPQQTSVAETAQPSAPAAWTQPQPSAPASPTAWTQPQPSAPAAWVQPQPSAPASPQQAGSALATSQLATWQRVITTLLEKKPLVAFNLKIAQATFDGDRATVAFPEDSAAIANFIREPENLAIVTSALKAELGRPIEVQIKLVPNPHGTSAGAGLVSLHNQEAKEASEERKRREEEAKRHPLINSALSLFGTQVKEIKTDVD